MCYFIDKTDGGKGALSTFASESPIYRIGGGSGIALNVPFGKAGDSFLKPSSLTLGYLASNANVKLSFTTPISVFNNNVNGTLNLLEALRILNQKPMIQIIFVNEKTSAKTNCKLCVYQRRMPMIESGNFWFVYNYLLLCCLSIDK